MSDTDYPAVVLAGAIGIFIAYEIIKALWSRFRDWEHDRKESWQKQASGQVGFPVITEGKQDEPDEGNTPMS